jgi:hypothetical protein
MDHDHAVSTREYQTDQSSPNLPSTTACLVLEKINLLTTAPNLDTVIPYQLNLKTLTAVPPRTPRGGTPVLSIRLGRYEIRSETGLDFGGIACLSHTRLGDRPTYLR